MRKKVSRLACIVAALGIGTVQYAAIPSYLTQEEYTDYLTEEYTEDRGIVLENQPKLGYLTYKNSRGEEKTCFYYGEELTVENKPYYEAEDKIGYLDELFESFNYDPSDTKISELKVGDCIYLRQNEKGNVVYISISNDYMMRYGKIISYVRIGDIYQLQLQDEQGKVYSYRVPVSVPVKKGVKQINSSQIKVGSYAKVLVCQKILGEGIIEEEVMELVVDNDTRTISHIYRGQVGALNPYRQTISLKNSQSLEKSAWGTYNPFISLNIDTQKAALYYKAKPISSDYLRRYLINHEGYVYVATENDKGKEEAIKLNFQSAYQKTLPISPVVATNRAEVKLLSGETLKLSPDTIIVREDRLVEGNNILVGDALQAVVTEDDTLAVGKVQSQITMGSLGIYRGRIKKINEGSFFEVETFSQLVDGTWYYHPTPQTFSIGPHTQFYNESGLVAGGVNNFLGYGSDSQLSEIYTIIAKGSQAQRMIKMNYTEESVRGQITEVAAQELQMEDVSYYDTTTKKWFVYSKKNSGATLKITPQTVIIKNGELRPVTDLVKGDQVRAMVDAPLKDHEGIVTASILVVEN